MKVDRGAPAPTIRDLLSIRNRYVRAVNIERDLADPKALDGYLLTNSVQQAVNRLCAGLLESSTQRAWRITGNYGGGKSALGLLVASLFAQPLNARSSPAAALLHREAPDLLARVRKLPRYTPLVITGTRGDASFAVATALRDLFAARRASAARTNLLDRLDVFSSARKQRENSPSELIQILVDGCDYLATGANASEGLLLIVDEMGRWLEYAADPDTDVEASFFQELAEACGGRSRAIPLALLGILHQRFEDYTEGRRDRRAGVEWAKVAERFEEITFSEPFESTCQMVATALNVDVSACKRSNITDSAKAIFSKADELGVLRTANLASGAGANVGFYPFHPTSLVAATTMFRRFGQNERSTFSFLLSSEPFALQDFASRHRAGPSVWYRIHHLCDWLLAQGAPRTLDEERIKRWTLLQEVLRGAPVFDDLEVQCLKTVGLLTLLEPQPGVVISPQFVAFALDDDGSSKRVHAALSKLIEKRLLYVRPASQELCLWPQSSVDVAAEIVRIRKVTPKLMHLGNLIDYLPAARPIVAHRHYLETGTLRAAHVVLVDTVEDVPAVLEKPRTGDAQVIIVPCYEGSSIRAASQRVQQLSLQAGPGTLLALRRVSEDDLAVAQELLAWRQFERECTELRVDPYARGEVVQSIHRLTANLVHRLSDLRMPGHGEHAASWWCEGERIQVTDGRSLNRCLSKLFDALYDRAPAVRNELINRTFVSTAAAAARQRLLERMFSHADVEDLGIEMTPPEKAIYLSVLKEPGLHAERDGAWSFVAPASGSPNRWAYAWNELGSMLDQHGLVTLEAILRRFAEPPFGMRESITLLMVAAFMRVHSQDLILRERGTYLTQVESGHLARMLKRPESFELHMVSAVSSTKAILGVYKTVLEGQLGRSLPDATVAILARGLFEWYLALPEHTLNTASLDLTHRAALALMGKAGDPVELLTTGLPLSLGVSKEAAPFKPKSELDLNLLRSALTGFIRACSNRLDEVRGAALKVLAEEAGVRDTDGVRPHVIALAERIKEGVTDYTLRAFIQRCCDASRNPTQWIDSLASLLGGRSIEVWHDDTLLRFRAEARRIFTLLSRVVALEKLSRSGTGADHAVVAVHVVDQKGMERYVAVPADAKGAMPIEHVAELKAMLERFPVPAYTLARLLLDYSAEATDSHLELAS